MEPYQYRVSLRAPQKVSAGEKETAFPGLSHARVGGVCVCEHGCACVHVGACLWRAGEKDGSGKYKSCTFASYCMS